MVTLLSNSGDEVLNEHLRAAPKNATYMRKESQNSMINIVGKAVREGVLSLVRKAKKFVVLMDETQDLSNKAQVSVFVRLVLFEEGLVKIEERLLAVVTAEGKTGKDLETLLLDVLKKYDLDLHDIVGQCYDGRSNMAAAFKGVQARILAKNPNGLFTYCYAHSSNRAVINSCDKKDVARARNFFSLLEGLVVFINRSATRHKTFLKRQEEILETAGTISTPTVSLRPTDDEEQEDEDDDEDLAVLDLPLTSKQQRKERLGRSPVG